MFQHMFQPQPGAVSIGRKSSNPRGCEQNIRYWGHKTPIAAGSPEHRQRLKDTGGAGTHSRKTYRYEPQELSPTHRHANRQEPMRSGSAHSDRLRTSEVRRDPTPAQPAEQRANGLQSSGTRTVLYSLDPVSPPRRCLLPYTYKRLRVHTAAPRIRVVAGVSLDACCTEMVTRKKKKNRDDQSNNRVRLRHRLVPCADNHFRPSAPQCRG